MAADPLSATNPRRKTPLQRQTAIQTAVIRNLQRGWPMSIDSISSTFTGRPKMRSCISYTYPTEHQQKVGEITFARCVSAVGHKQIPSGDACPVSALVMYCRMIESPSIE